MCANCEPIRLSEIAKLDLRQPTFNFVGESNL